MHQPSGQGARRDQGENQTLATITAEKLLPALRQARRHDRHRQTEAASCTRSTSSAWSDPDQQAGSARPVRPHLQRPRRQIRRRWSTTSPSATRRQPVLIGTTSVERSEYLSRHSPSDAFHDNVLNANPRTGGGIVAVAGRRGGITVATTMAGRGTDIGWAATSTSHRPAAC
ncbi:translocase subunit secA 1 domain protein [Mycobacterium kansasii]|uniref:Translocase subunit secA 1 domain protein n=1 Tax=Mycobacterium kansasii TaxID=1768 RepID=A0A1V3W948_MYCKA|nr:translocase subunit secA 1 domain protein [Mycobacterium kansasii]